MRAMIMAAGLGTRLRPLTGLVSKPMVPVLNRPAIHHILVLLRDFGIREVVVNLHHFPDAITSYLGDGHELDMSIRYSYEEELLGTAGGVKNNEDFLGGDSFLVLSGDALTDLDLQALVGTHRTMGGIATLALKEVADPSQYGVMVLDDDNRVVGFQEKPSPEEALSRLCNCGIYMFEPEILDHMPPGAFYDFGKQVFPDLLDDDVPFYAHEVAGYWNDVGNLTEYRRGNFDALQGRVDIPIPGEEREPGVWVGARTWVDPAVNLEPPVLIGDECRIEGDASIRGPAIIGDHCVVERGANIRESILWSSVVVEEGCRLDNGVTARAAHLRPWSNLRDAVVGERAIVGRGLEVDGEQIEPNTAVCGSGGE